MLQQRISSCPDWLPLVQIPHSSCHQDIICNHAQGWLFSLLAQHTLQPGPVPTMCGGMQRVGSRLDALCISRSPSSSLGLPAAEIVLLSSHFAVCEKRNQEKRGLSAAPCSAGSPAASSARGLIPFWDLCFMDWGHPLAEGQDKGNGQDGAGGSLSPTLGRNGLYGADRGSGAG